MERTRLSKLFWVVIGCLLIVFLAVGIKIYNRLNLVIHYAPRVKVTLREGLTNQEMAIVLAAGLPNFNTTIFLEKTKNRQGYLFPDTYFFNKSITADGVIGALHMNFNKKVVSPQNDVVVMASILEKEASGKRDVGVIAGILWKRITLNMPLQVDAAPETYKEKGLPVMPISNPGLVSIFAALHPIDSPYLYYLHDKNGMVHYAKTFAEHKKNIGLYLK